MRQKSENRKTFVVSVLIGAVTGTPWPLGRLHICDESITVRSLFKTRTSPKSRITHIWLEKYGFTNQLLFEASSEIAGVAVLIGMIRLKGVVAELRRRGYPVVDRRPKLFPLPQGTGPWQGVVPWHDDDDSKPPARPAQ